MDIPVIRSKRKTLSLQIRDGSAVIRAPFWATDAEIESFVQKHKGWLEKNLQKANTDPPLLLSPEQKRLLIERAKDVFAERCAYFSEKMGLSYGKISVRMQQTRWGSCSRSGNLSFNALLMLAPPQVLDSVVTHELCHLVHMDHSADFYEMLYRFCPDYPLCRQWLRDHGTQLMAQIKKSKNNT